MISLEPFDIAIEQIPPLQRESRASKRFGIPIYGTSADGTDDNTTSVWVDTVSERGSRETVILGISTTKAAGTYGVGELIDLQVTMSDEVLVHGLLPRLRLNLDNSDPCVPLLCYCRPLF